jgi:ABC-2 type transport system ATP-binding protein
MTTHYMDEAERLCDRIGVIDHGKMIAYGRPLDLVASLGGQQIVEVVVGDASNNAVIDLEALGRLPGVRSARLYGERITLNVERLHLALPRILAHFTSCKRELRSLSTHHATLEDVFVNLTGRHLRE